MFVQLLYIQKAILFRILGKGGLNWEIFLLLFFYFFWEGYICVKTKRLSDPGEMARAPTESIKEIRIS